MKPVVYRWLAPWKITHHRSGFLRPYLAADGTVRLAGVTV